jgi:putative oxidoreductase
MHSLIGARALFQRSPRQAEVLLRCGEGWASRGSPSARNLARFLDLKPIDGMCRLLEVRCSSDINDESGISSRFKLNPMKYLIHTCRILLGLVFTVFGLNFFFHFMPGAPPPGPGAQFIGAISGTGYLYVIGALQLIGGLCLLTGRLAPLGLTLLGPVIVNILLFHLFMVPSGMPIAILVSALALFLLWVYRYKFPAIFRP